ncbi:hypothetical protein LTR72_002249 [Exophiala xenobiotica]|nr:hypothetical protein LTR72_002249 [Exophiala xenobiotica]KAK5302198.1 hypothetical protein LTR14_000447 [Exophiala xenobiotica]
MVPAQSSEWRFKPEEPVYGTLPVELLFDKTGTDQSRSGQSLQPHWPELSDSWVETAYATLAPVACIRSKSWNAMLASVPSPDEVAGEERSQGGTRGDAIHDASLGLPLGTIEDDSVFASFDDVFDNTASYDWFVSDVSNHQSLHATPETSPSTQFPTGWNDQKRSHQPQTSQLDNSSLLSTASGLRKASQRPNVFQNPAIDQGDQVLQFKSLPPEHSVVDCDGESVPISIAAQLQGNFFLANSQPDGDPELTIHRRNLFRISGMISPSSKSCCVVDELGNLAAVASVNICLTAMESIEGKRIEVIQVSSSKTGVPALSSAAKDSSSPTPVPIRLDLTTESGIPREEKALSFMWKRLQFRSSTANNGRRNGVQQKYLLKLTVKAILATGKEVCIAETESSAIIVRGRSAGLFMNRENPEQSSRTSSPLAQVPASLAARPDPAPDPRGYVLPTNTNTPVQTQSTPLLPWSPVEALSTNRTLELRFNRTDSVPQNVSDRTRTSLERTPWSPLVIDASAYRLEDGAATSNGNNSNKHALYGDNEGKRSMPGTSTSTPGVERLAPEPEPDPLYEYFPLGLEGWMPPVDAVYRPHIAHNTLLVPDLQALFDNRVLY